MNRKVDKNKNGSYFCESGANYQLGPIWRGYIKWIINEQKYCTIRQQYNFAGRNGLSGNDDREQASGANQGNAPPHPTKRRI